MTTPEEFLNTRPEVKEAWRKQVSALETEIRESHQAFNKTAMNYVRAWLPNIRA